MNYTFYKIICNNPEIKDCYVGSTKNIENRIRNHHYKYRCGLLYKVYNFMRDNGGIENFTFTILEKKVFEKNTDAYQYEQLLINNNKSNLNVRSAYITEENKKKYQKNYYKKNKNELSLYQKKYQKNYKLQKKLSIENKLYYENFMKEIVGDAL